jgi:hypothetical protein
VGANTLDFSGGAATTSTISDTMITNFSEVQVTRATLAVDGSNSVDSDIRIRLGGKLKLGSGDSLSVAGNVAGDGDGGTWVLDLIASPDSGGFINAQSLDITNINLQASNVPTGASGSNPVILATYQPGQLVGSDFKNGWAGLTLGPNQRIDYSFNGNSIAIVPEPSLALPILAGFLPLFGFRRRSRR